MLIENEEVTIEVCEDSVLIAKSYFEYISNISRYSAFGSAQAISSVVPLVEPNPTAIADIDDMMFTVDQSTPKLELKAAENNHEERMANLIIEENFFKASEFSEEYRLCEETAGFSCFIEGNNEWEALLEVPLPSEKNDETLVLSNSQGTSLPFHFKSQKIISNRFIWSGIWLCSITPGCPAC